MIDVVVLPDGQLQVRSATEIAVGEKSYHRYVLRPGDDLTGQPEEVVDAAKNTWTNDVILKYNNSKHPPVFNEHENAYKLRKLMEGRESILSRGYTCSNGIRLDVDEADMNNWSKLMVYILAFHPETVKIRDYDNITHEIESGAASAMMSEVASWYQSFMADTWAAKDTILNN